MWVLRQKSDGSLYLTFDKFRFVHPQLRGVWQYVGPQGNALTDHCVRMNENMGYYCMNDDEGGVQVLVLED